MSLVLAVETSCDETAVAILRDGRELLASEVWSQADVHSAYGGVVPEVASRNHLAALPALAGRALRAAGVSVGEVDAFAATIGPGLPTALLVGVAYAKALAIGCGRPFLAVNHIEGHLFSPFFGEAEVPAHLGLVVSGGHTLLVDVTSFERRQVLGSTLDDAAGEAFDKVAKLLGLGYPGGIEIERLAREGDPKRYDFPRSMLHSGDLRFSFSGLKTAVRYLLDRETVHVPDVAASFQAAVIEVLVEKTMAAARRHERRVIALSGGVSSNAALQAAFHAAAASQGLEVRLAPRELRTDNAAMIAYVAALRSDRTGDSLSTDVQPSLDPARLGAILS